MKHLGISHCILTMVCTLLYKQMDRLAKLLVWRYAFRNDCSHAKENKILMLWFLYNDWDIDLFHFEWSYLRDNAPFISIALSEVLSKIALRSWPFSIMNACCRQMTRGTCSPFGAHAWDSRCSSTWQLEKTSWMPLTASTFPCLWSSHQVGLGYWI